MTRHVTAVEMYREGTFRVAAIADGSNRCGLAVGDTFRYEVRLFAPYRALDRSGFLLDARAIEAYWQEKYATEIPKTLPSCERIAGTACNDLWAICRSLGVKLTGVEVRIWGGSHSAMAAHRGKVPRSVAHPHHSAALPLPRSENIPDVIRHTLQRTVNNATHR